MYSHSIQNLIEALKNLPSVGTRTAERYVFHLLKAGKGEVAEIKTALEELLQTTRSCEVCWNFSDSTPCPICRDRTRDHSIVGVVAEAQDIPVIEKTGEFRGYYHVLRGLLDSADENSVKNLKIKELLKRLSPFAKPAIKEAVLMLNPDLRGETTSMLLERQIKKINPRVRVSRLARGLPLGSDLQYADEITLGQALKNRK